jgi:hypothetical protein
MRIIKYLFKSINLLNLFLLLVATILAVYILFPLAHMKLKYVVPDARIKTLKEEKIVAPVPGGPSALDYIMIGEQNLFHPERKIPVEKKPKVQVPKPDLILYGTVISNTMHLAYIENKRSPQTSPGRGQRQILVKKGDVISGFALKEIEKDRILLTREDESATFYLTSTEKRRGSQESRQTTGTTPFSMSKTTTGMTTINRQQPLPFSSSPSLPQPATPSRTQSANPSLKANPSFKSPPVPVPPATAPAFSTGKK